MLPESFLVTASATSPESPLFIQNAFTWCRVLFRNGRHSAFCWPVSLVLLIAPGGVSYIAEVPQGQAGRLSVLLAVSAHPSASSNALLLLSPGVALLGVPNHGLTLAPGSHSTLGPLCQTFTFSPEVTQPKLSQFPCNPRAPHFLLLLIVATEHQQEKPACCSASPIYDTQVTQITSSNAGLSECLCLMLGIQHMKAKVISSLLGICSFREEKRISRSRL